MFEGEKIGLCYTKEGIPCKSCGGVVGIPCKSCDDEDGNIDESIKKRLSSVREGD